MPVASDPGGFDAWEWQDQLATGVTIGVPPDRFNLVGQDWGMPAVPSAPAAGRSAIGRSSTSSAPSCATPAASGSTTCSACSGCGGSRPASRRPRARTCGSRPTSCSRSWRSSRSARRRSSSARTSGSCRPGVRPALRRRRVLSTRLAYLRARAALALPAAWPSPRSPPMTCRRSPASGAAPTSRTRRRPGIVPGRGGSWSRCARAWRRQPASGSSAAAREVVLALHVGAGRVAGDARGRHPRGRARRRGAPEPARHGRASARELVAALPVPIEELGVGSDRSRRSSGARRGAASPRAGRRIRPASGGRVSVAEHGCPCHGSSTASTPPRLPRFEPP